jgi:Protein of unknown function (DUF5132)
MALFNGVLNGWGPTLLIGVGVAVAAPILLPAVAAGGRPLARTLIRGGLAVAETVQGVVAEVGEQLSDLVAEVQEERAAATPAPPAAQPSQPYSQP